MELKWGDSSWDKFVSNVGLITTRSKAGESIMAAAWTYVVSYKPGLIAVCIGPGKITWKNIKKNKKFGVSLASNEQNVLASIAGGNSGRKVDKIGALKDLGYKFYEGKKAEVLLVSDSAVAFECKLVKSVDLGDHTMFVGEVLEVHSSDKEAVVFYDGKYHKLGSKIEKPEQKVLDKIKSVVDKHTRGQNNG